MKNFIQRVDSFLALLKFKDSDNIKKYSHNIISYVETLDNLGDQEFLFSFLFKVSEATENDLENFSNAVYLLSCHKKVTMCTSVLISSINKLSLIF